MKLTPNQALQKGIEAHKAGRVKEADQYYTAILKIQPKHPDANHNMGVLAVSLDKAIEALPFFKTALEVNPAIEQYWLSYINALIKLDRKADAKAVFDQAKNNGAKGEAFNHIEKRLNVLGENAQKPKIWNSTKLGQALKLAKKKVKEGSYEEAQSIYRNILDKFPKNEKASEGLKKLTSAVRKTATNNQNLPKDKLKRILAFYTQGNLKQTLDTASSLLKEYPNSVELYNIQGAAYDGLGLLAEAIKSYRNALIIKPDHSEVLYNIGIILQKQSKFAEAIDAYREAISIRPDYAEAYNNIGVTFKDAGKLDEATEAYRKAIDLNSDFSEPYNNLAVVLKMQGKLEEAVVAYTEAIKIDPENASAHRNLSTIKKYKKIDNHINQVEDLYKNSDLSAGNKCKLCFALAKMYEDIGNLGRAFDYLSAGNALRKKLLRYSINHDKQLFVRLKDIQPALAKNALKIENEINSVIPVFIVGMPRSGTTLIEQILSSHSKILGAGELTYLPQFGKNLSTVFNSQTIENLLDFRRRYLSKIKELSDGYNLITDKNPLNFRLIPLICAALPEAKIVHITRNAAAICWSNYKHYFPINGLGYCYDLKDVISYYNLYTKLMQTWQTEYENKIYHLNYEKITTNQMYETRRVIEYLGLEWEEACLYPDENTRYVNTASQLQVKQKVYAGSSTAWRKYEQFLDGALDGLANL